MYTFSLLTPGIVATSGSIHCPYVIALEARNAPAYFPIAGDPTALQ